MNVRHGDVDATFVFFRSTILAVMASTHAYDALKAHAQAVFSPPYSVLDFDEIDEAARNGTDPFLVLEEATGVEEMICFGDPQNLGHRETGVLLMHFFTPAPVSSSTARALAENVQDAFRLASPQGVRILSASPPDISAANDGIWTIGVTAVAYEYDRYFARP